jgi:hypothetical protein
MTDQPLTLDRAPGYLRKISINVLNKDAAFTLFTLPIEGVPLSREQLNAWLGPYTFESWYEQRKDNSWHPMPWFSVLEDCSIALDTKFACKAAVLTIGRSDYRFEEYCADEESDEDDEEGDDLRPGARISALKLKPTAGGTTMLSFHMQVRPTNRASREALLEHMYRHLAITFLETSVVARRERQQALALEPAAEASPVVADQTGHQSPPPIVSKGGEAIDAENHARHPEAAAEVMGADAQPDPDATNGTEVDPNAGVQTSAAAESPEELAKLEEGMKARTQEFQQRAAGAIDGTTMRSRRRRRGDDATH